MDAWVRSYAAGLGAAVTSATRVRWVEAPSGARLAFVAGLVVKLHHGDTDEEDLTSRLAAVSRGPLEAVFVPPIASRTSRAPDGSIASAWPEVPVLTAEDRIPWSEAGRLLAHLHRLATPSTVPLLAPLTPAKRVGRAVERAAALPDGRDRDLLVDLGHRLLREVEELASIRNPAQRHTAEPSVPRAVSAAHGDFHLGQLGLWQGGWRLLDIDDLGVGDPAWDLARPAGFWAAGLVPDGGWEDFLDGYRGAAGPAVPAQGDPWPSLDLPARCAVHVAAVRVLTRAVHSDLTADALLAACRRM